VKRLFSFPFNEELWKFDYCTVCHPYLWAPHPRIQQTVDGKYLEKIVGSVTNMYRCFFLSEFS
jgi:hypothetical protein